jgi:hypothetical protein
MEEGKGRRTEEGSDGGDGGRMEGWKDGKDGWVEFENSPTDH